MSMGLALGIWLIAWGANARMARSRFHNHRVARVAAPLLFGLSILVLWEAAVSAFSVSPVILPAPSDIAARFAAETGTLWEDFVQTVLKGALSGYVIGAVAAFLTAIAIDRSRPCRHLSRSMT